MRPASRIRTATSLVLLSALIAATGCRWSDTTSIAVIPRTSGTILWEPEDVGAETAAAALGERIYWNASTREDDIDGQIALVDRMRPGKYRGLVLAPDHARALITPVRRALASGLPIVVVGSPLPIPANEHLAYVLNDEQEGGRLAAQRASALLQGQGKVALIGIDPDIAGIVTRAESFEQCLLAESHGISIVARRMGTFNFGHEQEGAEELLRAHPDLDVIVALTAPAIRGALSALQSQSSSRNVKVIGFDPEGVPFEDLHLDSVIVQNTRLMGDQAVRLIHARLAGQPFPAPIKLSPTLVTRQNLNSLEVQAMLYARWQPPSANLKRSVTRQ